MRIRAMKKQSQNKANLLDAQMNIVLAIVLLVVGLVILWKCAELLVAGAVALARRLGVSSLVVGLTVVAMGTSAPELAASIAGVLRKSGEGGNIAIGNVFGSNIANLALVGGLVALIRPLMVKRQTPVSYTHLTLPTTPYV